MEKLGACYLGLRVSPKVGSCIGTCSSSGTWKKAICLQSWCSACLVARLRLFPWNVFAHRECPFIVSGRYWLFKNTMEALYPRCLRHEGPASLCKGAGWETHLEIWTKSLHWAAGEAGTNCFPFLSPLVTSEHMDDGRLLQEKVVTSILKQLSSVMCSRMEKTSLVMFHE